VERTPERLRHPGCARADLHEPSVEHAPGRGARTFGGLGRRTSRPGADSAAGNSVAGCSAGRCPSRGGPALDRPTLRGRPAVEPVLGCARTDRESRAGQPVDPVGPARADDPAAERFPAEVERVGWPAGRRFCATRCRRRGRTLGRAGLVVALRHSARIDAAAGTVRTASRMAAHVRAYRAFVGAVCGGVRRRRPDTRFPSGLPGTRRRVVGGRRRSRARGGARRRGARPALGFARRGDLARDPG